MKYLDKYTDWCEYFESNLKYSSELKAMTKTQILESFSDELTFGTGGLRGIMRLGTNGINIFTIKKATQGVANYLRNNYDTPKVAIAYDTRNNSRLFAEEAVLVFLANNIEVVMFDESRPTPMLSYAVRHFECSAGIVITASHNPPEYNGYKVYNHKGGQITPEVAKEIIKFIEAVNIFRDVKTLKRDNLRKNTLLSLISDTFDDIYINNIRSLSCLNYKQDKSLKIVYTPLHGSGHVIVPKALKALGFKDVFIVDEQSIPDGNFPTIKSPNPEDLDALKIALSFAESVDADIVFGTDPDCDRVGVAIKHAGEYIMVSGNQIGALLVSYLVTSNNQITLDDVVIKTIVTSDLGANIAKKNGASIVETLTGFKYIGEKIAEIENSRKQFLLGYEESYGYLIGDFVRDKDATIATVVIADMANSIKKENKTLVDELNSIYDEYGYVYDSLDTYSFEGIDSKVKMNQIMAMFTDFDKIKHLLNDIKIYENYIEGLRYNTIDNRTEDINLPKASVVKIYFNDGSWIALRPSGTEPKFKIYYSITSTNKQNAKKKYNEIFKVISDILV